MKNLSKNNLIIIALVLLISCFGITYAFFRFTNNIGENHQMIAGEIYMNLTSKTDTLVLDYAFPETKEEARARDDNTLTFTIEGKNTTTNKDIFYEVLLDSLQTPSGRIQLDPSDLVFDLVEEVNGVKTYVVDAMRYPEFNKTRIFVDMVSKNTDTDITRKYTLRMWVSEDVIISDTESNADYTSGEYAKIYASIQISVNGDFIEKASSDALAVSGKLKESNTAYDVSSSYDFTKEVNENVVVTISGEDQLEKIIVKNQETNQIMELTPNYSNGIYSAQIEHSESGTFTYYGIYSNGTTSGIGTYNVRIDKALPDFFMENGGVYNVENVSTAYTINNTITSLINDIDFTVNYALVPYGQVPISYQTAEANNSYTIKIDATTGIWDLVVNITNSNGEVTRLSETYTITYNAEIVTNKDGLVLDKEVQVLVKGQEYNYIEKLPNINVDRFAGYATDTNGDNMITNESIVADNVSDIYLIWYQDFSGSVTIEGVNEVTKTLVANTDNISPEGEYTYQWYSSNTNSTSDGTAIQGATSKEYTLTANEVDKYVYVLVTATKKNYITKVFSDITDISNTYEKTNGTYEVTFVGTTGKVTGGIEITNLIKNGDLTGDTTGWSTSSSTVNNSINGTITSDGLYIEDTSTTDGFWNYYHTTFTTDHVYYASVKNKLMSVADDDYSSFQLQIRNADGSANYIAKNDTTSNDYQKLSVYWTSDGTDSAVQIGTGETYIVTVYAKDVILVDLTEAFGAGNEPTKEWCDRNISYYGTDVNNIITTGSFTNSTVTGWSTSSSSVSNTIKGTVTSDGLYIDNSGDWNYYHTSFITNHIYYARAQNKMSSVESGAFNFRIRNADGGYNYAVTNNIVSNDYKLLSIYWTSDGTDSAVQFGNPTSTILSGYTKNVMLIDLTEMFGVGHEPSQEWCDKYLSYFTTTSNFSKMSVSIVDRKFGSAYAPMPTATMGGYVLKGWYTGVTDGEEILASSIVDKVVDHTLYAHWTVEDSIAPTCSFTGPEPAKISRNATAVYYLYCTDNVGFENSTLSSSDFTLSNTGIVSLSAPSKTTVEGGYQYVITVTGISDGSTTLTLNANSVTDLTGNGNTATTSSAITVATAPPTCNMSVSETGLITATYSDNGGTGMNYYGYSSSYSGTLETTKQLSAAGTVSYYVKDNAGNTNSCSITVKTKTQYRYQDCSSCKTCSSAGCASYNSWVSKGWLCRGSGNTTGSSTKYTGCYRSVSICGSGDYYYCQKYTRSCASYKASCSTCGGCNTWGSWSAWSDTVYTSSTSRNVGTRTYYYS